MKTSTSRTSNRRAPKRGRVAPKLVPVSTVTQARGHMFAPTKAHGESAHGKLRRVHRDILDYLIRFGNPVRTDKGNVIATVPVAGYFSARGKSDGTKSRQTLEERVTEIVETAVKAGELAPGKDRIIEPILSKAIFRTDKNDQCVLVAWFGDEYLNLVANETHINSDRLVLAVLKIKHDVTAMVVRWLLSHARYQRHALDELIYAVGVPRAAAERTMRKYRAQILDESAYLEQAFGITVVALRDGRTGLDAPRNQAVWFIDPVKFRTAPKANNGTKTQPKIANRHENPTPRHENPAA